MPKKNGYSRLLSLLFFFIGSVALAQEDSIALYFNRGGKADVTAGERLLKKHDPGDSTKVFHIANKLFSKESKVKFFHAVGDRYYHLDDYETARFYYNYALKFARLTLDKKAVAEQYAALGDMFRLQDQNTSALKLLFQAMYLYKEIGEKKELSHVLSLIGDLNRCVDQHENALKYLNEGLEIATKNNYVEDLTFCYSSMGGTYQALEQFDKAIDSYQKGLKIATELKDTMRIIDLNYSMGDLSSDQGKLPEAELFMKKGIELSAVYQDRYYLAFCHMGLSKILYKMKRFDASVEEGLKAFRLGEEMKAYGFNAEASEVLYKAYEGKKDLVNAYKYLKIVKDNNDSTLSSSKIKQQAQLEIDFKNSFQQKQDSLMRYAEQTHKDLLHNSELHEQKLVAGTGIIGLIIAIIVVVIVFRSYRKQKRSAEIISSQKQLVDIKNKEILDSINYARRIQQAIIPSDNELKNIFPDSFVLLLPKDIVSGDFYWVARSGRQAFFALVDCTGHGVPGGFMSMLGTALLNEIVNEKNIYEPSDILDMLKLKIIVALRQSENPNENKDGMDIALFRLDLDTKELNFAGANNSLYLLRDSKLQEFKADKFPVGFAGKVNVQFTQQKLQLQKGDLLYLFSDGYPDQFGGPQGKKFKYKPLEELLLKIAGQPMNEQCRLLQETHDNWKGTLEQVDDICVAGIRI